MRRFTPVCQHFSEDVMDEGDSLPRHVSLLMTGSLQGEHECKTLLKQKIAFSKTILKEASISCCWTLKIASPLMWLGTPLQWKRTAMETDDWESELPGILQMPEGLMKIQEAQRLKINNNMRSVLWVLSAVFCFYYMTIFSLQKSSFCIYTPYLKYAWSMLLFIWILMKTESEENLLTLEGLWKN